jgi:filamentous hemagglutinin
MCTRKNAIRPRQCAAGAAAFALTLLCSVSAQTTLPQPCGGTACGAGPTTWVSSGQAAAVYAGNQLDITQVTEDVTLNWESFDVGPDGVVNFLQPSETATALNQIFQGVPSAIRGQINANGRVILINQNGVIFGDGAQVNVRSLIASSLRITEDAVNLGLIGAGEFNAAPAFEAFRNDEGEIVSGDVVVENGAVITAEQGDVLGQVILLGTNVANAGDITVPGGQVIIAAGDEIFLLPSQDDNLRGLVVELGRNGGTVTNGAPENATANSIDDLVGRIESAAGNVTLAGLIVNQDGLVQADTTVAAAGSVILKARDSAFLQRIPPNPVDLTLGLGGELNLGPNSITATPLSTDGATSVDSAVQPEGQVTLAGERINLADNARVAAPSGQVQVTATSDFTALPTISDPDATTFDDSGIYLAAGATIDVSGASIELPVERNLVEVSIFSNEVRDSPVQRALLDDLLRFPNRGDSLVVDLRESGVRGDGLSWQGTPFVDATGAIAGVSRDVFERSLDGGEILIETRGGVVLEAGSRLDVSGGEIRYVDGFLATTQLAVDGNVVDIVEADPNVAFDGLADQAAVDVRGGTITEFFSNPGRAGLLDVRVTVLADGSVLVADGSAATGPAAGDLASLDSAAAMAEAARIERLFDTGVVTVPTAAALATDLESAQAGAIERIAETDPDLADFIEQSLAEFYVEGVATFDSFEAVSADLLALQALAGAAGATLPLQVTVDVPRGRFEAGYIEGKDAGLLQIIANAAVLDGDLTSAVVQGERQRIPTQAFTAGPGLLYRDVAEVPFGGALELGFRRPNGSDFVLSNVQIEDRLVLPDLLEQGFDPKQDSLEGLVDGAVLRGESLRDPGGAGEDGFASISLSANGSVTLAPDTPLSLAPGARLDIEAQRVVIGSSITAPSGRLAATATFIDSNDDTGVEARAVTVADEVTLDYAGRWINDLAPSRAGLTPTAPLWVDAGEVVLTLSAAAGVPGSALAFGENTAIDVSAGALLDVSGELLAGRPGAVDLVADINRGPEDFELGVALPTRVLGFGFRDGGRLSIDVPQVCIANTPACGAEPSEPADDLDGEAPLPSLVALTPSFFEDNGFSTIRIGTTVRGLEVLPGTELTPRLTSIELLPGFSQAPSGTPLASLVRTVQLDDALRGPLDLTLDVRALPAAGLESRALNDAVLTQIGELVLGSGTRIALDPGSHLTLESNTRVIVEDTEIEVPAGAVDFTLATDLESEFVASQGIWLDGATRVAARGATVFEPNELDLALGRVLDGGRISVTVPRGLVSIGQSVVLDVSGTEALLDVRTGFGADSFFQPTRVTSDGGLIELIASEALLVNGRLQAAAPADSVSAGGALVARLDPNPESRGDQDAPSSFPIAVRRLALANDTSPVVLAPRAPLPVASVGTGRLPAAFVDEGGFDSLSLFAGNYLEATLLGLRIPTIDGVPALGRVILEDGVDLTLRDTFEVGSAVLEGAGSATVRAGAMLIGPTGTGRGQGAREAPPLLRGNGALTLEAQTVQFFGNALFDGFATASVTGHQGISFSGVLTNPNDRRNGVVGTGREQTGSLRTRADLDLIGAQLFPTTLSEYRVQVESGTGRLSIRSDTPPGDRPLSVAGSLSLFAAQIVSEGTIRAPFGQITLDAQDLVLGPSSLTDTAGGDSVQLFGTTVAGQDLTYNLSSRSIFVFEPGFDAYPARQQLRLQGASIDIRPGATIDASGGGDILAYEFVPGIGGTRDVLALDFAPGTYAILPSVALALAPRDITETTGFDLPVGTSVTLLEGSDVPAGEYLLLPPRYALLYDDAALVRQVDLVDPVPGNPVENTDGSVVVPGTFGRLHNDAADSRLSGFEVTPISIVRQRADYTLTSADTFFSDQAATLGVPTGRRPVDSGLLTVVAQEALSIDGDLLVAPGTFEDAQGDVVTGRGVAFDLSAQRIALVPDLNTPVAPDAVAVEAASLLALNAESLLLGASREETAEGTRLSVSADDITVAADFALTAPELILAANDSIVVSSGASLSGVGEQSTSGVALLLPQDASLLRLSSVAGATPLRAEGGNGGGVLEVEAGAVLSADGAIDVDAGGRAGLFAPLDVEGRVSISGNRLLLGVAEGGDGEDEPTDGAVVLSDAVISGFQNLDVLLLTSRSTIDLLAPETLTASELAFSASALRYLGDVPAQSGLVINARRLSLGNPGGASVPAPAAGMSGGTLQLVVDDDLVFTAGDFAITGFADLTASAGRSLAFSGDSVVMVDGDIDLSTPVLTRAGAGDSIFAASGDLALRAIAGADASATTGTLGGVVALAGETITLDTQVQLPSGRLLLESAGGGGNSSVSLGANARLMLAGRTLSLDGVDLPTSGGSVSIDAGAGGVSLASGAVVDLSGGAGAPAGTLAVTAAGELLSSATYLAASDTAGAGGAARFDVGSIADFDALNSALEGDGGATTGGFDRERLVRVRSGELRVGADQEIRALRVALTADQGEVVIGPRTLLDARGDAGGVITLAGADGVSVGQDAQLLASSMAAGPGGRIELLAGAGSPVEVAQGSRLALGAGTGAAQDAGTLLVRVSRDVAAAAGQAGGVLLDGIVEGARRIDLEASQVYQVDDGVIGSDDVAATDANPWFADARDFIDGSVPESGDGARAIAEALGLAGPDSPLRVLPGLELRLDDVDGGLVFDADWNLAAWRFTAIDGTVGAVPGVLTVRSSGDVRFGPESATAGGNLVSLSDGFSSASNNGQLIDTDSWSYRLVAGADLASADLLAVVPGSDGDFLTSPGRPADVGLFDPPGTEFIRTGNGDIDIRASGDLVFRASEAESFSLTTIYTAGVPDAAAGVLPVGPIFFNDVLYANGGGDLRIEVLGDVIGVNARGTLERWVWRVGEAAGIAPLGVAWAPNVQLFSENVGSLAGGDLTIRAGGDIIGLSAAVASAGIQDGELTPVGSDLRVVPGGDLFVEAGGNIVDGVFSADGGRSVMMANNILPGTTADSEGTLLYVGGGSLDLLALGDVTIQNIIAPTSVRAANELVGQDAAPRFANFDIDSTARIVSLAGTLTLDTLTDGPFLLPPRVRLEALSGTLRLGTNVGGSLDQINFYPTPVGNFEAFAGGDIEIESLLIVSDADPTLVDPGLSLDFGLSTNAAVPIHSDQRQPDGIPDDAPVRLVAGGDIVALQSGATLNTPKFARVVAGGDLFNLQLLIQNLRESDVSSVLVGGDLIYEAPRNPDTGFLSTSRLGQVFVDGPGRFEIAVQGDLALGTATGIATRGDTANTALPDGGADVSVSVGLADLPVLYTSITDAYLRPRDLDGDGVATLEELADVDRDGSLSDFEMSLLGRLEDYQAVLIDYLENTLGRTVTEVDDALAQFDALSRSEQGAVIDTVYFGELRAEAEQIGLGQSTIIPAVRPIELLYPGSVPNDVLLVIGVRNAVSENFPEVTDLLLPGNTPEQVLAEVAAQSPQLAADILIDAERFLAEQAVILDLPELADVSMRDEELRDGDALLFFSRLATLDGGSVSVQAPGGLINVGLATPPAALGVDKGADELGIVAFSEGDVSLFLRDDLLVNESRVFTASGGDILVVATSGNIDAGRGAQTSLSAPAPETTTDIDGFGFQTVPAGLAGSGIRALVPSEGSAGAVVLGPLVGEVLASDAGIAGDTVFVPPGTDLSNIQSSGAAPAPPPTPPPTTDATAATQQAASDAGGVDSAFDEDDDTPGANRALGLLDVEVLGFEDEEDADDR